MTTPPDPAEPDPAEPGPSDADPDVDDDAVTVDPSITSALASGYAALSGVDLAAVRNAMRGFPLGELNRMQGILDGHRANLDAARNAMSSLPLHTPAPLTHRATHHGACRMCRLASLA